MRLIDFNQFLKVGMRLASPLPPPQNKLPKPLKIRRMGVSQLDSIGFKVGGSDTSGALRTTVTM